MTNPKYTLWEAVNAALAVGTKALKEVRELARVPGPPGDDGLGFEDMNFEQRGERNFVLKFARGGQVREFPFCVPSVIYRGVWREGQFQRGDMVTWGGSLWHCDKETGEKPGSGDWTLAVKKGRDGKDAPK